MRVSPSLLRGLFGSLAVLVATACASGGGMAGDPMMDQALVRVLNDSDEPTVTVSIEPLEGNAVPLGVVEKDRTESMVFELPEGVNSYRLIAVGPEDETRDEYHISPTFVVDGGATVNWYLLENELEVN